MIFEKLKIGENLNRKQVEQIRMSPMYYFDIKGSYYNGIKISGNCNNCGFTIGTHGINYHYGCPKCKKEN